MSASYIAAIDQGTSSSRFLVFDNGCGLIDKQHEEINQILPKEGWIEQDPVELYSSVVNCMEGVATSLNHKGISLSSIKGIGIANQRETTIVWDKVTGKCLYNAIVWCDNRTEEIADNLIKKTPTNSKEYFAPKCGLPIHPYFSALKLKWILQNVPETRTAVENGTCLFGTVDTWLIWNLTGGINGGIHITDITNASRTMLMNLETGEWDLELCHFFGVPLSILPRIRSSAEIYGNVANGQFKGVPIAGCLGDQQAALVGQKCFQEGDAKNTYGTGCFLLYNTGTQPMKSTNGLLTTVGYKLGPKEPVHYALEGSVAIAGQSVRWLRDNLSFFNHASEIESIAATVSNTGDLYFVPAFSGLFAPYWQHDARGIIIGMTNFTNKAHICRALLEAVCFQTREILEAMNQDSELPLASLKVDGGMTVNNLLLQLQADLLGIPVERPDMSETTALGATLAAGKAVGLWSDLESIKTSSIVTFSPSNISHDDRDYRYSRWKEAVKRCMKWHRTDNELIERYKSKASWTYGIGVVSGVFIGVALSILYKTIAKQ